MQVIRNFFWKKTFLQFNWKAKVSKFDRLTNHKERHKEREIIISASA